MPRTKGSRALPDGRGRAGVELGGTSGYRVGRGLGCRLGVVERHTVEPVLPLRGPLNGTAFRHVPRPEDVPRWLRQRAQPPRYRAYDAASVDTRQFCCGLLIHR